MVRAPKPDGSDIGTLIPGVEHFVGGQYDAGGDPSVTFDSRGHVYYAGLGFDRTAPPNTIAVNKGSFDSGGHLSWANPVFVNQTSAPSTLNDKPWLATSGVINTVRLGPLRRVLNRHRLLGCADRAGPGYRQGCMRAERLWSQHEAVCGAFCCRQSLQA